MTPIRQEAAAQEAFAAAYSGDPDVFAEAAQARIADCDAQLARYRASIDAGGDPAAIGPWIAETQAKKVAGQAEIRTATGQRRAETRSRP